MLTWLRSFYRPAPAAPRLKDEHEVARLYRRWRWSMFLSVTFGYGFYYTCRLPLSVTKKPLLESGALDTAQMGAIGMALLVGYAVGKLLNGFLADHVHLRRFMVTGMAGSALLNLAFGVNSSLPVFVALWAANGYLQAMGAPSSGVAIANWFSDRERGTRYAIWCISHNIGEGITFAGTALLVAALGWRWGFLGPGINGLLVALVLRFTMADRPRAFGLPPIAEHMNDRAPSAHEMSVPVGELQREVLTNPHVWILGLGSALMYVARYAVNNWAMLYLQLEKGYGNIEAGFVVGLFPIVGSLGSLSSGWISDRFFAARRTPATVAAGVLLVAAQLALYFGPPQSPWIDRVAMGAAGFAIGCLLVFLGGLTAMDICSKRAAGAALGVIGGFSYVGAGIQDWVSGTLIKAGQGVDASGKTIYDFTRVKYFWVAASILSTILGASLWGSERRAAAARAAARAAEDAHTAADGHD
ncbi:MAG: MFS transporter [Deltaproteobacteria bacterium]|nr:MAG: MFS transporter [Pseudomonadota bacterium]PIE66313.1 MAG: MFS transporter [Deltaproteobacteria bacterium]